MRAALIKSVTRTIFSAIVILAFSAPVAKAAAPADKKLTALQKVATAAVTQTAAAEKTVTADRAKFQSLVNDLKILKSKIAASQKTVTASAALVKKQQAAIKATTAAKTKTDAALAAVKKKTLAANTVAKKAADIAKKATAASAASKKVAAAAKGKKNEKALVAAAAKAANTAKLATANSVKLAAAAKKAVAAEKPVATNATKATTAFNAATAALKATQTRTTAAKAVVAKGAADVKKAETAIMAIRPSVLKRIADFKKLSAATLAKQKAIDTYLISAGKMVSFSEKVAPIFVSRCLACHNARTAKGRFNMESFTAIIKGGESGGSVELGNADDSNLYAQIEDGSMPKDADPLTKKEMAIIKQWINTGAKLNSGVKASDQLSAISPKATHPAPPNVYRVPIPVTALAFSLDGKQLASSGYHEVILWNPTTGKIARRITNVAERVYDLEFSPDGKTLAVAAGTPGQLGEVKLFDPTTGKLIADFVNTNDSIFSVSFRPDGKLLAAAGADRAIRVFDLATKKEIVTIEDHADWVMDIAWSPDGNMLASASRDKTSKVFDMKPVKAESGGVILTLETGPQYSGDSLVTYNGHGQPVFGVAFNPDGKSVITSGADKQIRVWGVSNAKQVRAIGGFGSNVFRIVVSKDGRIFSSSADKTARIHTAANGKAIRTLSGHTDWVYSLSFNKASGKLATGSYNGEVRVWNVADGKQVLFFVAAPGYKPGIVSTK